MWFVLALLSAVFAALTAILAKVGVDSVNGTLATAIRTTVVLVMAWGMVFLTQAERGISTIARKSWIFLILSGVATGASWLCYYHALKLGRVNQVAPIDKLSCGIHAGFCGDISARGAHVENGTCLCFDCERCALAGLLSPATRRIYIT